ncbi:hypothetical protein VPH35_103248 [Triticum aestivum]
MSMPAAQLREDGRYPPHPPEKYHRTPSTPKSRVPRNTFRKECDGDVAAARTGPRVSPGTRLVDGKGYHRRPSRSAPPNMPPTSLCHHGYRTNFTVSLRPPTRGLEGGRGETGLGGDYNAADRRGQPPPRHGADRTTPVARAITTSSHSRLATTIREPRRRAPNRRPAPTQMGPKGPRSGPSGHRPPAARHAAPQPTATPSRQGRSRPADSAAEPHRRPPSSTAAGRREPRIHLLASGEGMSAAAGAIRATPVASAGGGEG